MSMPRIVFSYLTFSLSFLLFFSPPSIPPKNFSSGKVTTDSRIVLSLSYFSLSSGLHPSLALSSSLEFFHAPLWRYISTFFQVEELKRYWERKKEPPFSPLLFQSPPSPSSILCSSVILCNSSKSQSQITPFISLFLSNFSTIQLFLAFSQTLPSPSVKSKFLCLKVQTDFKICINSQLLSFSYALSPSHSPSLSH